MKLSSYEFVGNECVGKEQPIIYSPFRRDESDAVVYVCIRRRHWGALVQLMLLWKSNNYHIFWVCICSLRYPACNVHLPYCHLCPIRLYNIVTRCLIQGTIFGENLLNIKCILIFSKISSEAFLIIKINERDMFKNVYWLSRKLPVILVRFLWNLHFRYRFSKNSQISNLWNSVKWQPSFSKLTDGPTCWS
jgi:hypothetical protein